MATRQKKTMKVRNVLECRQDYLVQVTLKNDEIYAVSFRRDPKTEKIEQLHVFQTQWDQKLWSNIPKLIRDKMYLNTKTNELELYPDFIPNLVPPECTLVTYEMFDHVVLLA